MFIRAWVCIQWNMYRKYVWLIFFWDSSFHTHLRNFLNWMTVWYQPCRCFIAFWTCAINSIPDICIKEIRVLPVYISPLLHFHFPEDTNIVCLPEFIVRAIMQQAKIYGVLVQGWHSVESPHPPLTWRGVQIPVFAPSVGWVRSWLVLSFALRGFSPGTPVFFSPQKPTFLNSNSTRNQVDEEPICGCATCKSLLFIYFIYLFYSKNDSLHCGKCTFKLLTWTLEKGEIKNPTIVYNL